MLSIADVSKSYGVQPVLNQVSFTLNDGDRVGLVGANGVGKSTLLKIIVGEIEADQARIAVPRGMDIGYLPQTINALQGQTVDSLIAGALQMLHDTEQRLRDLELAMSTASSEALAEIMDEYAHATEQFERLGGYDIEHRIVMVLNGLRVGQIDRTRQMNTLSGGEKSRVGLAMLLLRAPTILLLDEPTNHLDVMSLQWLESYLSTYHGAMFIVSHDRQFLNQTVTAIVEIDEYTRQAKRYTGDYDAYLAAKALERRTWLEKYEAQQEELKALRYEVKHGAHQVAKFNPNGKQGGDKFAKGFFKGRADAAVSRRVQNAEERLRRIEADPIPEPPEPLMFDPDFDPRALESHTPLIASQITKVYGERIVLDHVSLVVGSHTRIALVGPNGAGKSTLLRILAGQDRADEGTVTVSPQARLGVLDQENEGIEGNLSLLDLYRDGLSDPEQVLITRLIACGFFRYEEIRRPVRVLSSGQKRKLQIARLIAVRANVLLLDEPTNFISFDVLEAFESAIRTFPGPVVAASHDRRFLQAFNGEIWELREGKLIPHFSYAAYMEALQKRGD